MVIIETAPAVHDNVVIENNGKAAGHCSIYVDRGSMIDCSGETSNHRDVKDTPKTCVRPKATTSVWGGQRLAASRRAGSLADFPLMNRNINLAHSYWGSCNQQQVGDRTSSSTDDSSVSSLLANHPCWNAASGHDAPNNDNNTSGDDALDGFSWDDDMSFWSCRKRSSSGDSDMNDSEHRSTRRCIWQSNHLPPPPFLGFERLGLDDYEDEDDDQESIEGSDFSFLSLAARIPACGLSKAAAAQSDPLDSTA
jgi:hypothetical protein